MAMPEQVEPASRAEWRSWLSAHHERRGGVWLVIHKKASPTPNLTASDAVEEALCFGWIDSVPRKLDDHRTLLYFAPRTPGSGWSAVNKRRIERLRAAGLLAAPGLARIEEAIADGSWLKLDAAHALNVPPDLRQALDAHGEAATHWETFAPSARRALLEWIGSAKTAATRERRVRETAQGAARGERANPGRPAARKNGS